MNEHDNEELRSSETNPGGENHSVESAPPAKTPMSQALNAERYQRQALIRTIQKQCGNTLICYVAGGRASITRDDTLGICELLHNIPRNTNLDLLLHTGGGDVDAAEKLMYMVRNTVGSSQLRVIVPDYAKSAGTLMALAADYIVMSDSSELGPIDPQIMLNDGRGNLRLHSVMNYLDAFEFYSMQLRGNPNDLVAHIMLAKLDPATVKLLEAAKDRAQQLAESHLQRWMFRETPGNFTKLASDLMDTTRWFTHGQMIDYQAAQDIGLQVQYLEPTCEQWRAYWQLYCHQKLAIKDTQKLFESDYVSLPLDGPIG